MNLDDESLLSAYMDGQLDPDQHQAVESALLSNPQLSEQLRTLTILRDLVGGLSRDASVDVSFAVLERIRPPRRWWVRLPATIPWPDRPRSSFASGRPAGNRRQHHYRGHRRAEHPSSAAASPFQCPEEFRAPDNRLKRPRASDELPSDPSADRCRFAKSSVLIFFIIRKPRAWHCQDQRHPTHHCKQRNQ